LKITGTDRGGQPQWSLASTTDQAAATRVMVGAVMSTTAATMAALANWICSAAPWMTKKRARTVTTTAITRGPAAFGGGGAADRAVAVEANETMQVTGYINNATKQRWMWWQIDTIDNTLMVLRALCKIEVDIPESMYVSDKKDRDFEYDIYFFVAFKRVFMRKEMCISFISWLQIWLKWSLTRTWVKKCWQRKKVNRLLMYHKYMFLYYPDMHRPSLNSKEQ
jgi:hypothetical protein